LRFDWPHFGRLRFEAVLGLAVPLLLLAAPVRAHEVEIEIEIETRSGVVCDTREQAQRLTLSSRTMRGLRSGSSTPRRRMPQLARSRPWPVCAGPRPARRATRPAPSQIVEVLVLGIDTPRGLQQASPAVYFTLFKVEESPA